MSIQHFLSHKLTFTHQRWPVIEKEAYAIVYALQKHDYYLNGARFTIKTHHKPLKYLFKADWTNNKWLLIVDGELFSSCQDHPDRQKKFQMDCIIPYLRIFQTQRGHRKLVGWFLFNAISNFVSYLMPKTSFRRTVVVLFNP